VTYNTHINGGGGDHIEISYPTTGIVTLIKEEATVQGSSECACHCQLWSVSPITAASPHEACVSKQRETWAMLMKETRVTVWLLGLG